MNTHYLKKEGKNLDLMPGEPDWKRWFAVRPRIHDKRFENFPKLYQNGTGVALKARNYLTANGAVLWSYLRPWLTGLAFVVFIFAAMTLFGSILDFATTPMNVLVLLVSGIVTLFSFCLIITVLSKNKHTMIGGALFGHRLDIEFYSDRLIVYKNGYGLSMGKTIWRGDTPICKAFIDEPEDERKEARTKSHKSKFAAKKSDMLERTYLVRVKLEDDTRPVDVAEVYGMAQAELLKVGIENAEAKRQELIKMAAEETDTAHSIETLD